MERLYKAFEAPALRGVEFAVDSGSMVGVIGAPGAGKSLLLRVLAGLVEADAGSVRIDGREVVGSSYLERLDLQAELGMAFQNIALFEHMTVGRNVAFPLERRGFLDQAEVAGWVSDALELVGLGGFEGRAVGSLSGGQKRRVGLARAAIHHPRYLLCDEPAAGLDPVTTSRIFQLLRRQQAATKATVIVVSSDVERLLDVVDEVIFLQNGRVAFHGTVEGAFRDSYPGLRAFLDGARTPLHASAEKIVVGSWSPPATLRSGAPGLVPASERLPPGGSSVSGLLGDSDPPPSRGAALSPRSRLAATPDLSRLQWGLVPGPESKSIPTLRPLASEEETEREALPALVPPPETSPPTERGRS